MKQPIFVFGSNLAGRHGGGSAKAALMHHGAIYGQGEGLQGNSYGIPTKGYQVECIPLEKAIEGIKTFISYAKDHPELFFQVTRVGCGRAGFTDEQIAPLFKDAPDNCSFDLAWEKYLPEGRSYWGSVP